ncbi:hypothetical protein SAMN05192559_10484 [Halobacillus karajensis]|uniref:DUF6414 family protein n=1 Tax=Halobacillus karajensis TaxID=195088 RepID=UPI0008A7F4E5|nr:hypothetical protein [Halobacillus karajensis]SEH78170.1 hypothetical protein SAMN05192559_10484 [Halobacillus karajensis]
MFLPTIYWCDGKKTEEYLEMLIEDFMKEYSFATVNGKDSATELSGNIGKIAAKYRSTNQGETQREGSVSRSTAALFTDLHQMLEGKQLIQSLYGFDEDIWKQLTTGEFVEVEGEFKQSPAELVLSSTLDFFEQFKSQLEVTSSPKELGEYELMSSIMNLQKVTSIIQPYVEGDYKFFTSLDSDNFHEDRYELEGEFTILGKIKKIYKPLQEVDLIKMLPGKMRFKKSQLMSLLKDLPNDELDFDVSEINEDSFTLKGPAIELTPIAIYQK